MCLLEARPCRSSSEPSPGCDSVSTIVEDHCHPSRAWLQSGMQRDHSGPSTFDVMKQAKHEQSQARTPTLTQERNRKDKLYNVVIENLKQCGLQWRADEVESSGVNFAKSLTEVLCYIDGHHTTFSNRGCHIPPCFANFQEYNVPELSKHRKHASSNMSTATLHALAQRFFVCCKEVI